MKRNDSILFQKFIKLMIPSIFIGIAIALNEFVDAIMVSQLLGNQAMAVVNIGSPVMFVAAAFYSLLGVGGSVVYSGYIGEKKMKEADNTFGMVILISLIIGLAIMIIGLAGRFQLSKLLVGESGLFDDVYSYLRLTFYSFPLIVLVMSISYFLPAMNYPILGCLCSIIANSVNIIMDYVYIKYMGMGVQGAAAATFTGYIAAGIMILILFFLKKIKFSLRNTLKAFKISYIIDVCKAGLSSAFIQFGLAFAGGYCNTVASSFGKDGIVCYSFYKQLNSIFSIFMEGIKGASNPIYSMLNGADDKLGLKMIVKKTVIIWELGVVVFASFILLFPNILFSMFNIKSEAQISLCRIAIYAYSIYIPVKGLIMIFRMIMNTGKKSAYAVFIAICDTMIGVILFAFISSKLFGVNGLLFAEIINVTALLLLLLLINAVIYLKNNKNISYVFLSPKDNRQKMIDVTITTESDDISDLSKMAISGCKNNGFDHRISTFAGLLIEEMYLYTRTHCSDNQYIDILMKKENNDIRIDFRSIGKPFNPMILGENDLKYNVELLNNLVKTIKYGYALGMNTTSLILGEGSEKSNECPVINK